MPSTSIVVGPVANGATMIRPEIHWLSVPAIETLPPRGRFGWTVIGGVELVDSSSIPVDCSASSSGPIGRRWKYFWPVIVTGASASEASPTMK